MSRIAVAAFALAAFVAGPAFAEGGIRIELNQAKIVKLARAADTIVVGNPQIADASVQDSSTVVLTGRGFDVTNLVILDSEGNPIIDEQVTVSRQTVSSARVYRRADIQTLSCTPYCEGAFRTEAEMASEIQLGGGQ